VVAGGVVDSNQTRSFLETGPPNAETGWAVLSPNPSGSFKDKRIGVLTLISGLDRIGLASFFRAEGATARIFTAPEALVASLADGALDAGVTEAMLASRLAAENGWTVGWVSASLPRYNVVLGLWKGDITLKRAIDGIFAELAADGTIAAILERYGVTPIP
jgi:polar amino acid transport system substrate-binding protein/cystine transport system substrate-binding protein/membrane-bound lytic murein transglycosylase F